MHRRGVSRRGVLKGGAACAALAASRLLAGPVLAGPARPAGAATRRPAARPRVAVVGAGVFGGFTALSLVRRGARVTLVDAWGPGNSRASSGGETRVIRAIYGPHRIYVEMVVQALRLWRENEARFGQTLYRKTGVLWMTGRDDSFERASLPLLRDAGLAFEELGPADAAARYPQVSFEGVARVILEKDAGYLLARRSCQLVMEGVQKEGGAYRRASAGPGSIGKDGMGPLHLSDGTRLAADQYVFACGPWLGRMFPEAVGGRVLPTRQEVFFFGTPAGDPRFQEESLPVWVDHGDRIVYGIPGNEGRGFKIADDTHGPAFDPDTDDRIPSADGLASARAHLARRFPGLAGAPLLEARVCQYENSPDSRFILDRLPGTGNAWIVGGGSGHGFKHGPAIGERVADLVLGAAAPDPFFSLARPAT
ncbi:MAG TPA: FAD-dependent oxidoreductase [Candidatus Binatia bacterium]|nr:FAD-dependent oxidoreductase [Candidatus Binatia bacterium]